jgi:hypothetical protein
MKLSSGSGKFFPNRPMSIACKCFNGISCRVFVIFFNRSHDLCARSSGRSVMPVSVPEGSSFGIDIDPDPDKLPTTHTCFGIVRFPLSFVSYASHHLRQFSSANTPPPFFSFFQGQITLPSVPSKALLKQKLDWCLYAAASFEYC